MPTIRSFFCVAVAIAVLRNVALHADGRFPPEPRGVLDAAFGLGLARGH